MEHIQSEAECVASGRGLGVRADILVDTLNEK